MNENQTVWTDREREVLKRLSDLLIPAGAGMPAASEVGAHLSGTDKVCSVRTDLVEPAKKLIAELEQLQEWSLQDIQSRYPVLFEAAAELLAGAYFLDEDVARTLDYREQITIPLDPEATRTAELQELTAPVVAKGNIWRTTV
ncbi:hypothetical protein D477_009795 [Arthrobacter crystallopoietes BAB-32]|uniref:Uncharacterized protein n=1 Tax=Arthrobacter crystallopoietes BAB-32 TaxID=1246476 RepID=N1V2X3_9MICC|nr:hypothetical protein [Arthrobacter crystallopoietes]EMY34412.1 hypothetical protein D477_009795 [Arthrobacter crystallopoietes BAB-32]